MRPGNGIAARKTKFGGGSDNDGANIGKLWDDSAEDPQPDRVKRERISTNHTDKLSAAA